MNSTTKTASEVQTISRGFGRLAARNKVGKGDLVLIPAIRAARGIFPQLSERAFHDGFVAERRAMRG